MLSPAPVRCVEDLSVLSLFSIVIINTGTVDCFAVLVRRVILGPTKCCQTICQSNLGLYNITVWARTNLQTLAELAIHFSKITHNLKFIIFCCNIIKCWMTLDLDSPWCVAHLTESSNKGLLIIFMSEYCNYTCNPLLNCLFYVSDN